MLVWLAREVWLGCAPRVLCGDGSEAEQGHSCTVWLSCSSVTWSREQLCCRERILSQEKDYPERRWFVGYSTSERHKLPGTPCFQEHGKQSAPRSKGPCCLWDTGSSGSPRQAQGRGRVWHGCEARQWRGYPRVLSGSSWGLLPCPVTLSPVQVVNEVPHVAGQDDPVLPHVPVIPKHAHWNVGRHFRKLPQNIVKCPSSERRERGRWVGTSFC